MLSDNDKFSLFGSSFHMWATGHTWAPHARNAVPIHDFIWSLSEKGDCNSVTIVKSSTVQ